MSHMCISCEFECECEGGEDSLGELCEGCAQCGEELFDDYTLEDRLIERDEDEG